MLEDNGFFVIESSAILTYLAVKYEWTDLYPTDLQTRSRIDQYLAWHHSNTRKITTDLFRPLLLESVFGKAQPEKAKGLNFLFDLVLFLFFLEICSIVFFFCSIFFYLLS